MKLIGCGVVGILAGALFSTFIGIGIVVISLPVTLFIILRCPNDPAKYTPRSLDQKMANCCLVGMQIGFIFAHILAAML